MPTRSRQRCRFSCGTPSIDQWIGSGERSAVGAYVHASPGREQCLVPDGRDPSRVRNEEEAGRARTQKSTSHGCGSLLVVQGRHFAVKRGWRPKAGLTDRKQGTGEPEGSPTRAAVKGHGCPTRRKMAAHGGRAPCFPGCQTRPLMCSGEASVRQLSAACTCGEHHGLHTDPGDRDRLHLFAIPAP